MYSGGAENYKRTTTQLQGRGEAPPSGGPPCLSRAELMGTGSSTSAPSNGRAGQSGTITAASPDGTLTLDIDGRPVGIGSFASARILVTAG